MQLPILVGSKAAEYWGYLPPWRNGFTKDIDLIASEEQVDWLHEHLKGPLIKTPTRRIMSQNGVTLDIDIRDNSVNRKVREWSTEIIPYDFNSGRGSEVLKCRVAPMKVVVGCHLYTMGFNGATFRKTLRDMLYYESLGIELDLDWCEDYRKTAIEAYKTYYLDY